MKKLIILIALAFTTLGYSQAEFEKIALTENGVSASTNKINTQEPNGEINYIDAVDLPVSTATTNALDLKTTLSAGAFSGFAVTNNGDGTISVGSGIAYLRATNDQYAPLIKYPIAAYNNIPLVDNLNNYIVVSYNGGSPALVLNTTGTGIDTQTNSIAIAAARVGTTVHYVSLVGSNSDPNAKLRNRYLQSEGIRRVAGLAISATGRKIATTAGITYSGLIRLDVAAMNTNVSDTYTLAYNNGSTWTRVTGQTDINNTQYNNAGTLTALSNNNFRTDYIYALVNSPSKLYVILGNTQYNTIGAARLAPTPSSLPVELEQLGVLVGRAIIEKDAVTMEIASPFVQDFAAGAIENHNDLAGLQGGTAGEYNHLTDAQVALVDGSEQTINKQNSLVPDGTGVKFPTVDAVNEVINYTTPEQFGAVGDGVTDDIVAIQSAINSGKMVLMDKNYLVSGTVTVSNKTTIYGNGKISITANLPILDIKANDIVIDGIRFEGNGRGTATNYATTRPLQIGINLEGVVDVTVYKNIRISNVSFYNLGGAGIKTANNKDTLYTGGLLVSNCQADLCYIGYYSAERGEYNSFSNAQAINCEYGAYINAGNNAFSNIQFESNRTGMYYGTGVNPGKSTVTGGSINHSLDKGLDLNGLTFGQNFYGVQLQVNDIYVTGSDAVQFINCDIRSSVISVTTSTNTNFKNCKFIITPTFTGLTTCNFSSTEWLLTPPTGFLDTNEQPLQVNTKLNVNTGIAVNTSDFANQPNGTVYFSNGSTVPIPTISGKSLSNSGLFLGGLAADTNTAGDMKFNVRENDNTDFATLTRSAFIFSRFGTTLIDILRNGNTTFIGNITAPSYTGGATLTGTPTAPTATAGTNTTQIATMAAVQTAITNNGVITTATNITNTTLTDTSLPQNGKTLYISNGANNINYTVNAGITASFVKGGTGSITFVQGSGRTMVAANGTLVFNGAQYSTASVASFGTTDIVYIDNF